MKKCKYCQSEIDSNAKICPNCRKKQGKIPTWLCVIIIIIGIGMIASYQSPDTNTNSNNSTSSTTERKKLTLEEGYTAGYDESGYGYYIEGYVSNPTNKNYNYVQIMFTAYDSEGNTLSSCVDNVNNLEKGGKWKFKAICLGTEHDIAEVKFKEITGW